MATTKQTPSKKTATTKKPKGIIEQIIALYEKGKTQKQIVAKGFNKSTVYRQVLVYRQFNNLA